MRGKGVEEKRVRKGVSDVYDLDEREWSLEERKRENYRKGFNLQC